MNGFYIDHTKLMPIMLGIAGLYWATNKRLPDIVIVAAFLATSVSLTKNISELIVTREQLELALQNNNNSLIS